MLSPTLPCSVCPDSVISSQPLLAILFSLQPPVAARMSYRLEHDLHSSTVQEALAALGPDITMISLEGEQVGVSSLLLSLHSPLLRELLEGRAREEGRAISLPLSLQGIQALVGVLQQGKVFRYASFSSGQSYLKIWQASSSPLMFEKLQLVTNLNL